MDNLNGHQRWTLRERRLKAALSGVIGGTLVVFVGAVALRWVIPGYLTDVLAWAMGIVVAPIAAAVSASVMLTTPRRALASVGFALLVAFAAANLLDYLFTALILVPGFPGPFQGKPEWSDEEVDRVSRTWLLGRHIIACGLGVFGGAAVGVWLGHSQPRQEKPL